jgi:hypothetical protein
MRGANIIISCTCQWLARRIAPLVPPASIPLHFPDRSSSTILADSGIEVVKSLNSAAFVTLLFLPFFVYLSQSGGSPLGGQYLVAAVVAET